MTGAKRVAIANLKGGVGKSTTTVMLAEGLAYFFALKVLVVDLDPQATTTQMLLTEAGADESFRNHHGTPFIIRSFMEGVELDPRFLVSPHSTSIRELHDAREQRVAEGWISLIPAHPEMREIEFELEEAWYGNRGGPSSLANSLSAAFSAAISGLEARFDIILFDCPPHISAIALAGLKCSEYFVTPTLSDVVSFWGLKQFQAFGVRHLRTDLSSRRFIVVTRYADTNHSRNVYERLVNDHGSSFLGPKIKNTVRIQEAMERASQNSRIRFNEKYRGDSMPLVQRLSVEFVKFMNQKEGTQWKKVR